MEKNEMNKKTYDRTGIYLGDVRPLLEALAEAEDRSVSYIVRRLIREEHARQTG